MEANYGKYRILYSKYRIRNLHTRVLKTEIIGPREVISPVIGSRKRRKFSSSFNFTAHRACEILEISTRVFSLWFVLVSSRIISSFIGCESLLRRVHDCNKRSECLSRLRDLSRMKFRMYISVEARQRYIVTEIVNLSVFWSNALFRFLISHTYICKPSFSFVETENLRRIITYKWCRCYKCSFSPKRVYYFHKFYSKDICFYNEYI